jgi:hypothetical protein
MTNKRKPRSSKTRPEGSEEAESHRREDKPGNQVNQEEKKVAENTEPSKPETTTTSSPGAGQLPAVTPQQSTSQYIVTVENRTGQTKIEKLNAETGQRSELTQDEYAAIYVYASAGLYYGAPYYSAPLAAYSAPYSMPGTDPLVLAYFRGVSDYLKALTGSK